MLQLDTLLHCVNCEATSLHHVGLCDTVISFVLDAAIIILVVKQVVSTTVINAYITNLLTNTVQTRTAKNRVGLASL